MFLTVRYDDIVEGVREALRAKNVFTEPTIEEATIRLVTARGKKIMAEVYIGEEPPDEGVTLAAESAPDEAGPVAPVAPRKATA